MQRVASNSISLCTFLLFLTYSTFFLKPDVFIWTQLLASSSFSMHWTWILSICMSVVYLVAVGTWSHSASQSSQSASQLVSRLTSLLSSFIDDVIKLFDREEGSLIHCYFYYYHCFYNSKNKSFFYIICAHRHSSAQVAILLDGGTEAGTRAR